MGPASIPDTPDTTPPATSPAIPDTTAPAASSPDSPRPGSSASSHVSSVRFRLGIDGDSQEGRDRAEKIGHRLRKRLRAGMDYAEARDAAKKKREEEQEARKAEAAANLTIYRAYSALSSLAGWFTRAPAVPDTPAEDATAQDDPASAPLLAGGESGDTTAKDDNGDDHVDAGPLASGSASGASGSASPEDTDISLQLGANGNVAAADAGGSGESALATNGAAITADGSAQPTKTADADTATPKTPADPKTTAEPGTPKTADADLPKHGTGTTPRTARPSSSVCPSPPSPRSSRRHSSHTPAEVHLACDNPALSPGTIELLAPLEFEESLGSSSVLFGNTLASDTQRPVVRPPPPTLPASMLREGAGAGEATPPSPRPRLREVGRLRRTASRTSIRRPIDDDGDDEPSASPASSAHDGQPATVPGTQPYVPLSAFWGPDFGPATLNYQRAAPATVHYHRVAVNPDPTLTTPQLLENLPAAAEQLAEDIRAHNLEHPMSAVGLGNPARWSRVGVQGNADALPVPDLNLIVPTPRTEASRPPSPASALSLIGAQSEADIRWAAHGFRNTLHREAVVVRPDDDDDDEEGVLSEAVRGISATARVSFSSEPDVSGATRVSFAVDVDTNAARRVTSRLASFDSAAKKWKYTWKGKIRNASRALWAWVNAGARAIGRWLKAVMRAVFCRANAGADQLNAAEQGQAQVPAQAQAQAQTTQAQTQTQGQVQPAPTFSFTLVTWVPAPQQQNGA
ncbi:hypothetical protein Q8F55_008203 [Vanrija albida]|uniref:Uncharacterized protein n=1 Tax=Vanrija albida TaxID=181172 RepID=A0ABR3PVK4_9TREE